MTDPRDPFDQLAASTDEVVDPTFAARLRARIERALGASPDRITVQLPLRACNRSRFPT